MADDIALLGGFRQPVFDAQATFRLLMTAMAQPGSRHVVTAEVSAPDGLGLARTALVLTLVDADAPVWLTAPTPRLAAWLAFHTGARLVADAADAAFALVDRGAIAACRRSTPDSHGMSWRPASTPASNVSCTRSSASSARRHRH